ncbi:MAG: DNA primase [Betaproteobacteria bacterium]|nr:DNA primase [Betaproteobacteria bacterium]
MIPQSFIEELLHRVDIVDVVERYVHLKKAGANYQACCPFHTEKTPSFTVSPTKQFYHCFGCGAHGSAIGFVMEYRGLNFVEAVKELASSAGMTVLETRGPDSQVRPKDAPDLYALMQVATRYYRDELKKSEHAIAYLKKRGLTGEIAARYGIGYAPPGWQNLTAVYSDYGAPALVEVGLVVTGEDGKRYDRFRDRIMFPIVNHRGLIVGFGGRVLEQGEPKYLNSPETPLFEKGREVYGLYQARRAIRDAGKVVVVEGYMDVVALAQHGVEYAVATLGTATTPFHVQKLLRQADHVIYCFDGDEAGRRAAWRALENTLGQLADGKHVGFLFLPDGEDPDTYVRKFGKAQFESLLGQAIPLSAFLLRELTGRVDLATHEGRAQLVRDAKPLVTLITAPTLSLLLRKRLAELAGIGPGELDALYQIKMPATPHVPQKTAPRRQLSIVLRLIEMVLFAPQLAKTFEADALISARDVPIEGVQSSELEALGRLLEFVMSRPQLPTSGEILEHFRGTPNSGVFGQAAAAQARWDERRLSEEELAVEFCGAGDQLRNLLRRAQIGALHDKLRDEGWSPEDKDRYRRLQQRPAAAEK